MKFTIDIKDLGVSNMSTKIHTAIERGLSKAMLFAEGESKKSFNKPGKLHVRTGRLRSAIMGKSKGLVGTLSNDVIYAEINELGGTIFPKKGKYLKFQIQGNWVSIKKAVIPARPFLRPAVEDNMQEFMDIIKDQILGDIN